jgi:TolB-like protein
MERQGPAAVDGRPAPIGASDLTMDGWTRIRATEYRSVSYRPMGKELEQIPEKGFQLGVCYIEPAESKIVSSRGPEHVEPRVMDVLMVLVGNAGQTVSREQLIDDVWNTTFVSDEVLSRCISLLRKHLGDDPRNPRYIETIPKKGYRLIAVVSDLSIDEVEREVPPRRASVYESIAVLPFANLSDDSEYEYFSDGMAEELLTLLAKTSDLKVAARTSAFFFKDQNVDIRLIGERLGVDVVLTGSVRHTGNLIRIAVQLLDTGTGYHIWSEIYEKLTADFFELQTELSSAIIGALRAAMAAGDGEGASESTSVTSDFHAYQLYLQGKFHLNRRGEDPIRKSIDLFEAACARDESFVNAYIAMAKAYSVLPFYTGKPVDQYFERANAFATKALELDGRISEAHTVLAYTSMHMWEWENAEQEFQCAIQGRSVDSSAHQWYGQFLSMVGELERSTQQILISYDLDPVSPAVNERLAFTYLLQGKNELADEQFKSSAALGFERTAILEPYFLLLWRMKRFDEMEAQMAGIERRLSLDGGWALTVMQALTEPESGEERLLALLAEPYERVMSIAFGVAIFIGQVDIAFDLANRMIDRKELNVETLFVPEAKALRRDDRFDNLAKRVGLYDYWEKSGWPAVMSD